MKQILETRPIIISIETSGTTCGVALSEGERLTAEYSIFGKNLHDRLNAEFVRRILADNGITIEDVDAVAVSAGPGSFTGLRIGGSIAKGLCFGGKPAFISVPTLAAFANSSAELAGLTKSNGIIAAISGHKDFIYCQEFTAGADELGAARVMEAGAFLAMDFTSRAVCGTAAGIVENAVTLPNLQVLSAAHIAKLACKMYEEGKFSAADDFEPLYIMDFTPKTKKVTE